MKEVYNKYINNELKLEKWQIIGVICMIIVIAGIIGWLVEFFFYYANSGFKTFYMRGANFLPWINIYAWGALLIIFLTRKIKKHPILVFLLSAIGCGILEYFSGYFMYQYNGIRCWDYSREILTIWDLNGYVCVRSVLGFGFAALLLIYLLLPFCIYISTKSNKKAFLIITISLCIIFLTDELYNLLFARIFDLSRAKNIYKSIGFKYMNYFY